MLNCSFAQYMTLYPTVQLQRPARHSRRHQSHGRRRRLRAPAGRVVDPGLLSGVGCGEHCGNVRVIVYPALTLPSPYSTFPSLCLLSSYLTSPNSHAAHCSTPATSRPSRRRSCTTTSRGSNTRRWTPRGISLIPVRTSASPQHCSGFPWMAF